MSDELEDMRYGSETETYYDPAKDHGPACFFCQMGDIFDADVRFSPRLGDHYHPACAAAVIDMDMNADNVEEARACLADLDQRARDLGE